MIQKHYSKFFMGFYGQKRLLLIPFIFVFDFSFTKRNFHSSIFAFDTERAANAIKWQRCKRFFIIIKTPAQTRHRQYSATVAVAGAGGAQIWPSIQKL